MNWQTISEFQQRTLMDEWVEFLCFRRSIDGRGWDIAVCGYADDGGLEPMTCQSVVTLLEKSESSIRDALLAVGWPRATDSLSLQTAFDEQSQA